MNTELNSLNSYYKDLEGKYVFVTGAMRGIGKEIARALSLNKAHVVFNYRGDASRAKALIEELTSLGGQASALAFDMTDFVAMKSEVDQFFKNNPDIVLKGVVHNAGIAKDELILRMKAESFDDIMGVNLKGAFMLTSMLSRQFSKAQEEGLSVVFMSSVVGLMGNHSQSLYAASKAALIGYSNSLCKEFSSRNVRSNVVCPGFIETEMTQAIAKEKIAAYEQSIPLGKFGSGENVSDLVRFFLSKSSSYITGEVIRVDGGMAI